MDVTNPIRAWRTDKNLSLDEVCDLFAANGFEKPSAAKLSRIERDQNVPIEMLPAVEAVTGLAPNVIRPDLAKIFGAAQ